ncbi:conserved repeat domain protein [Methanobacterium lacus]|uniref:Conserved repeat domain protein n=1 Tax=Methanobacterium lacus (strain AL-21) TaxID=877455 RepID=F0T8J1_METLA|nr:Ig-like domain repeat protein [Methanobacterium lacus]ADZ09742.1 conserved repeat domain protein [Methanobacterium lacus]
MTNKLNLFFKRKAILLPLLLLSLGLIFNVSVTDVSATPVNTIYVNGSGGSDASDGSTWLLAKKTINNATGTAKSNGRVQIARGTYNESNIQINRNMTIIGENQLNTIVDGQQSGNSIFTVATDVKLTIINLTLTNGTSRSGGAIENTGTLAVYNTTFTGNSETYGQGGAIDNSKGSNLTVDNCNFINNTASDNGGGAISNFGTATISNSNFTNNSATSSYGGSNLGGAIENMYGATLNLDNCTFTNNIANSDFGGANHGGAIFNGGFLNMVNCTFTNNTTTGGGGAIYNNYDATITSDYSTFADNRSSYGGAVSNNRGTLNLDNCTFTHNISNYGGAISNYQGTLNLDNCTFTNNVVYDTAGGGAIYNSGGGVTVDNSKFTGNSASGYLAGGGAIYTENGALNVDNSTFTNNTASFWGGAIDNAGTLIVKNSTFTNNNVVTRGGAIFNTGTATVNFNRIYGNKAGTGNAIYNSDGTFDARYNWWGSNTNPSANISGSNVSYNPWIVLTVTPNPATIKIDGKSNINADLLHDSNGVYHDPGKGHVPDGLTVYFSSDSNGTVSPVSSITTNGKANTTFTGFNKGISKISATVDSETVIKSVTIKTTTKVNVEPVSGLKGDSVNLTARLTDNHNDPVKGAHIQFSINGTFLGTVKTNNNGIATLKYVITENKGTYPIFAEYGGNSTYIGTNNTNQLKVNTTPVNPVYDLYLRITSSNNHPKVGELFTLTYKLSNNGPDYVNNVTVKIPIPVGFNVSNITGDGNWTYNTKNSTITWTLTNVPVGDPYLYITGKTVKAGQYIFGSSLSSETLKLNSATLNSTSTTNKTDRTSTNTIAMQHTGVPIAGLLLAILMVIGGYIIPRLKK